MIVCFIIIIVVTNCLTIESDATNATNVWADLMVPDLPPSIEDHSNFTWIQSEQGNSSLGQKPVPRFSAHEDVRFELFTPKNPTESQILILHDSSSVKNSNFDPKHPTRIFVHGWRSQGVLTLPFANAYLIKGKHKVNFIAVDWTKGSDSLVYYPIVVYRCPDVANHLAKLINFLVDKHDLNLNDLTIIGHSLGAHIAGLAGRRVTRGKIAKIVGLDPALPAFSYENFRSRIHKNDAAYVEVIHTNAGILGFAQPIGTASFYPNGGSYQPGCTNDIFGVCSHSRAWKYYLESITDKHFFACKCDSYEEAKSGKCKSTNNLVQMGGEPGIKYAKGIFYLQT